MKLLAKGNTAEIYSYEDNLICKLFYPQYPTNYIEHEFHNATMAWKLGISTPKAYSIIVKDNRQGIVYDQIAGETLSVKFFKSSKSVQDTLMDKFVDFHKQLMLNNIYDAISYKDFLKMFSANEDTIAKINALPDGNCFLHGDFHMENVILDENGNMVLIDMIIYVKVLNCMMLQKHTFC